MWICSREAFGPPSFYYGNIIIIFEESYKYETKLNEIVGCRYWKRPLP